MTDDPITIEEFRKITEQQFELMAQIDAKIAKFQTELAEIKQILKNIGKTRKDR